MENSTSSFRGSLSQWLAVRCLNKRPRTQEFYRDVSKIILDNWSKLDAPISEIPVDDVLVFAQKVAHVCPSRWNTIVAALRYIAPSPAKALKRRRLRMRPFQPPTQQEFTRLLTECDNIPRTKAGLVVRFLASTGLRISEARDLKWEDVSESGIRVRAEISKNGFSRCVPLIGEAAEVLARLKAISKNDFVLPRGNCRKAIEKACRLAGLQRMSHHSFRHLFATRCIQSGVDMPTVARWLGHRDGGALLAKVYYHLADEHGRSMAQRVKIAA